MSRQDPSGHSAKSEQEPDAPKALTDAQLSLHRWRYRAARKAGMSWFDAKQFADSKIDIEEMRRLAQKGYPPDQLLEYLRD